MNEIKKQKPIDSTWRKLDDLFELDVNGDIRDAYREECKKLGGKNLTSEFTERYP